MVLIFSGCAHAPVSKTSVLQPSQGRALVVSQDPALRITHVDGEKTTSFLGFLFHGFAQQVELTPGNHTVTVWYGDSNRPCRSGYVFAVKAEAGDIFQIMDKPFDYQQCATAEVWIEGNHQGSMLVDSSRDEPVSVKTPRLEQSPFFKWAPPQGEGWIIEYRNKRAMALAKWGTNPRETYAIYLQVFDIPAFQSSDDFANYVKEGRQKDAKNVRFTTLEDTVEPYSERTDYCVSFHHVSIDHNPGGQSGLFKSDETTMESDGYVCRFPANKNVAVHFEYSHRAHKGQEDPQLLEKTKDAFAKLEF
jgi:hypothetical protein